ncbi:phage protein NinX family protein [Moellerella wisconsensis]|uniref:phage protein NinX family protein n=1 Tax=Moellerella wisconsensis TaxID=158849 RepID=UPI0024108E85|nr:phage protein NinX family protein [Moellerella wisconsensis]
MNKYTELSDFEINKKVAERLFLKFTDSWSVILVDGESFDPCNNPYDAMPIIIENKIGLSPMYHSNKWTADCLDYDFISVNKNPLRACMEVFLMKKDTENES